MITDRQVKQLQIGSRNIPHNGIAERCLEMDLEVIWRVICSLPKIIFYKLRYAGRLKMSLIQSFGKHMELHLRGASAVKFGKETVSRRGLNIRVEGGRLSIGDKCFFNTNCSITCMEKIEIGEWCRIANNVVIIDHDHNKEFDGGFTTAPILIGHHTWIGANCVILKGAQIGDYCIIGAGSVVKGKVESKTTYFKK